MDTVEYAETLCPLVFVNAGIFAVAGLQDNRLVRHKLKFSEWTSSDVRELELGCTLGSVYFQQVYNIDIGFDILNPHVFANTVFERCFASNIRCGLVQTFAVASVLDAGLVQSQRVSSRVRQQMDGLPELQLRRGSRSLALKQPDRNG